MKETEVRTNKSGGDADAAFLHLHKINLMNQNFISLLFAAVVLIAAVWLFIHISRKLRKGGGSMTTTLLGSTYLFYDKEKKKAVKYIVERKAGKKMEEQSSEEPEEEEVPPGEE